MLTTNVIALKRSGTRSNRIEIIRLSEAGPFSGLTSDPLEGCFGSLEVTFVDETRTKDCNKLREQSF